MTTINSFYRAANASEYATQLFSANKPLGSAFNNSSSTSWYNRNQDETHGIRRNEAMERAMARIIEIVQLGTDSDSASTSKTKVSETMGYITGAEGTASGDKLTIDGRSAYGIDLGAGDDVLNVKADRASNIDLGTGDDTLNLSADFVNRVYAGDGNDKINISADLAIGIDGGDGNDEMTIAGESLRDISGGAGDDTMTLEGNRIYASGGTGNDTVTFKQTGRESYAEYAFSKGDGTDSVTSNGPVALRFDGLTKSDLEISVSGDTLTAKVAGSEDSVSVTLSRGDASSYAWELDNGSYVLKVG